MRTQVRKWGRTLAIRIPERLALEAGLSDGVAVDIRVVDGSLVFRCAKSTTLESLLKM